MKSPYQTLRRTPQRDGGPTPSETRRTGKSRLPGVGAVLSVVVGAGLCSAGRRLDGQTLPGASVDSSSLAPLREFLGLWGPLRLHTDVNVGLRGWPTPAGAAHGAALGASTSAEIRGWRVAAGGSVTDRATPATPTPSASDAGPRLLDGRVVLTSAPLLVGAFGADASAGIERDAYDPRGAWAQRGARARTWAGGPTGGTWFGLGVTAPTRAGTTPRATEWQLGGWTQRGSILLSALLRSVATQGLADDTAPTGGEDSTWIDPTTQQVHHTNKRATGAVTPSAARSARGATDAIVGAGWMWGRAALHARLGRRLAVRGGAGVSSGSATWAGVGATLPPVGPLALGLDYVRQPADVVRGIPAAERFFAGLRWVPRPRSVAADDGPAPARPAGLRPRETEVRVPPGAAPGVRTLVVALGIVGSAEVQGDFTAWRPVALRPVGDGTWAADVVLAPGVHTLAVRTDGGAWRAPPGLPSADDAFGGVVGTLIVDSSPPATGP